MHVLIFQTKQSRQTMQTFKTHLRHRLFVRWLASLTGTFMTHLRHRLFVRWPARLILFVVVLCVRVRDCVILGCLVLLVEYAKGLQIILVQNVTMLLHAYEEQQALTADHNQLSVMHRPCQF
jgi:hypothetical protein